MKIKNQILGLCLVAVFVLLTGCGLVTNSVTDDSQENSIRLIDYTLSPSF